MLGQLYGLLLLLALLVGLVVSLRVLVGIAREGRERHRMRRAGELERYTEDEEYGPGPSVPGEQQAGVVTCPHCGAENGTGFMFCHYCVGRL